jgi:hypothetical protein
MVVEEVKAKPEAGLLRIKISEKCHLDLEGANKVKVQGTMWERDREEGRETVEKSRSCEKSKNTIATLALDTVDTTVLKLRQPTLYSLAENLALIPLGHKTKSSSLTLTPISEKYLNLRSNGLLHSNFFLRCPSPRECS